MFIFWFVISILFLNQVEPTYRSKFYGEVESDSFLYTKTIIPRHARSHSISIWAESPHLNPIVLLRYDGVPTMKLYDAMISIPVLPSKLLLVDNEPTEGVLFMAIYGGTEINKYRYFAGSPSSILVGVEAGTDLCSNEFESGFNCSYADNLPLSGMEKTTTTTITTDKEKYYTITVPSRTNNVYVKVNYEHIILDICTLYMKNRTLYSYRYQLHLQVYLDQPNEDFNSAQQTINLLPADLCKETWSALVTREVTVSIPRPLSGVWRVLVSMRRIVENYNSSSRGDSGKNSNSMKSYWNVMKSYMKNKFKYEIYHNSATNTSTSNSRINWSNSIYQVYEERINTSSWTIDITTQSTTDSSLSTGIIPMDSVRTPWVADGYYSLYSPSKGVLAIRPDLASNPLSDSTANPLSNEMIKQTNKIVLFSTKLPTILYTSMLGGGTVIALHVYMPHSNASTTSMVQEILDHIHFYIAVRAGGLPEDPIESVWDLGNKENETATALSPNAFILYSNNAVIIDKNKGMNKDSTRLSTISDTVLSNVHLNRRKLLTNTMIYTQNHEKIVKQDAYEHNTEAQETKTSPDSTYSRTYTWTVYRPVISNLYSTDRDGWDSGAELFMGVSGVYDREISAELAALMRTLEVGLSVVLEPCLKDTCIHGHCYTQQGDVSVSSCSCRYPWAGESCDVLSISYTLYIIQMILLVVSNCAMIPAVLLSLQQCYYFVATLLSISSISSGLYHLCDSDVYCIADLNFHSLQVLDVLSSVSSIACILLLYAPISKHMHSALSLLCIAVLVAFVTNDPTSPVNIALAGSYALGICSFGWAYVYLCPPSLVDNDKQSTIKHCCSKKAFQHNRNDCQDDTSDMIIQQDRDMVYSALSLQEQDVGESTHSTQGDLEMSTLGGGGNPQSIHSLYSPTDTAESIGEHDHDSGLTIPKPSCRVGIVDPRIRMPIAGMCLGLLGLLCFALQGRDDYYLLHSMWHVFMMISAYLLLQGRIDISSYII